MIFLKSKTGPDGRNINMATETKKPRAPRKPKALTLDQLVSQINALELKDIVALQNNIGAIIYQRKADLEEQLKMIAG